MRTMLSGTPFRSLAVFVLLVLTSAGQELPAQLPLPTPSPIKCSDPSVSAALASLNQSIQEDEKAVANCFPPNGLPTCSSSHLDTLNADLTQLNNEYQAELKDCGPLQAPQQPPVALLGIEVVQVVQDMNQSVPLIAGKQTWARAYLTVVSPLTVTGSLQIEDSSFSITNVQSNGPATLTPTATLQQMRQSWTASLNFPIPPGATVSDSAYTLSLADVSRQGGGSLSCANCKSMTPTVTYVNAPPLRLRIVPITYTDPNNTVISPRTVDFALLKSFLTRAYPSSQLIPSQAAALATTTTLAQLFGGGGCNPTNTQLANLRTTEINQTPNPIDARTHYYGMVAIDAVSPNGGFMRGCSPTPGSVASGPTGVSIPFYENYVGHELGHSFGRNHPAVAGATTTGFCAAPTPLDTSYPGPNGQISDSQGDSVGLDVGDPANSITLAVLPGTTSFDIMSYCTNPVWWMSGYTFAGILNGPGGMVSQDPSGNGPPKKAADTTIVGHFVSVIATINLSRKTGKIEFAQTVERAARKPTFATENRASLHLVDVRGKPLGEYPVNVAINSDSAPGEDLTGLVDAVIPFVPNTAKLELYFRNVLLDQRNVSKAAPTVVNLKLAEPDTLRWEATHEKEFPISFYVQGSADGQTWETIALGLTKPEMRLSPEHLRSYQRVRVVANDGFRNSAPVEITLAASRKQADD